MWAWRESRSAASWATSGGEGEKKALRSSARDGRDSEVVVVDIGKSASDRSRDSGAPSSSKSKLPTLCRSVRESRLVLAGDSSSYPRPLGE